MKSYKLKFNYPLLIWEPTPESGKYLLRQISTVPRSTGIVDEININADLISSAELRLFCEKIVRYENMLKPNIDPLLK